MMIVLSARWRPRCIFRTCLVGAGISSYTAVHVGLSASHFPTACLLLPEFWTLLLFGEAFAELVGALLLRSWLLASCPNVRGTVAILSLLLLPGPPKLAGRLTV